MNNFLKDKTSIIQWLECHEVTNYTLVADSVYGWCVDVVDIVDLSSKKLKSIPVKFNRAVQDFYCDDNLLEDLSFAPHWVGDSFICSNNRLTSLEGSPQFVGDNFECDFNRLTTLKHCPQIVKGGFDCRTNGLNTLIGMPSHIGGNFNCSNNQLEHLLGAPIEISGIFDCSDNRITTMEHCPQSGVTDLFAGNNSIVSLKGCPKEIAGIVDFQHNQLKTLEFSPKVRDAIFCNNNFLENLEFLQECPEINFIHNPQLGEYQKITDYKILKAMLEKDRLNREIVTLKTSPIRKL